MVFGFMRFNGSIRVRLSLGTWPIAIGVRVSIEVDIASGLSMLIQMENDAS